MKKTVNVALALVFLFSLTAQAIALEAVIKPSGDIVTAQEKSILVSKAGEEHKAINNNVPMMNTLYQTDPELVPVKGKLPDMNGNRFPSTIYYGEGSTGLGGFIFNTGDSAAVWFRPLTECEVTGLQIYFHDETELVGTDVTFQVREVLDTTSTSVPGNGLYDFSYCNATIGDWMGNVLTEYTMPLTGSDLYPTLVDIDFGTPVDVEANDFGIQVVGDFGADGADLLYFGGVGGAGTTYNHGIKYYFTGASYCDEGCWVPRLNFVIYAKVDYYGDPPPFITEVEDLPDVYFSCDPGPYEATAHIEDMGTDIFTGELTSVLFIYDAGTGPDTTELVGTGVDDVFTGTIPSQLVGTDVSYYWVAVDNGDENPDTSAAVQHTTSLELTPLSFSVREYTDGADGLILDDSPNPLDETYATRISDALKLLGYSGDFWNTKSGGVPSACELAYYDHLVIVQGLNSEGNLGVGDLLEADIMAFLDDGGNLLFTSADYIFGITGGAEGWQTVDPALYAFLADYLHVSDFWSDCNYYPEDTTYTMGSKDTMYTGINGNILTGAIDTFYVDVTLAGETSNWADEVIGDGDAESIFNVYSVDEEDFVDFGGVMYEGVFKTAFVPWHLEGIVESSALDEFLDKTAQWFVWEHVPVVSEVDGPTGPIFTSDDQTIVATVADAEGDPFTVDLVYSIDGGDEVTVAMTATSDTTYTAVIPGQAGGTTVQYYIVATDAGGSFVTDIYEYFIYAPSTDLLFILNNEMDASGYPGMYYLYNGVGSLWYWPDFWESGVNGLPTAELLAFYDIVIEVTSTNDYPFLAAGAPLGVYYNTVVSDWLALGNKNYVLTGDETFGIAELSWANVNYEAGSFFYEMGVDSSLNDINASAVTQLLPVDGDIISGHLYTALGDDTLLYDPGYEIEYANYLDGMVPTADAVVCFTDTAGTAVGVHREWPNGNKTMFLGFDALSLNGAPYVWWSVAWQGPLHQALTWFGLTTGIDNEVTLPQKFALHQNYPNPFNPITNIQFDLKNDVNVDLTIYNLLGQKVITLVNKDMRAGYHSIRWNGTNAFGSPVGSGVYIYQISAGDYSASKKMLFLK